MPIVIDSSQLIWQFKRFQLDDEPQADVDRSMSFNLQALIIALMLCSTEFKGIDISQCLSRDVIFLAFVDNQNWHSTIPTSLTGMP